MPRNVTGSLMGDPGHGPSPSARAGQHEVRLAALRLIDEQASVGADVVTGPLPSGGMPAAPSVSSTFAQRVAPGSEEEGDHPTPELRPVAPITAPLIPGKPPTAAPVFMDVAPTELLIDGSYQRDLADRGLRPIGRIVEGWDWRRFKPPVCAWTDRGLVVIDGQHTAIAAATHGGLTTIPVMVVEAKEARDQASAFVGHNRDRMSLHATQIHHGAVVAGDPEAMRIEAVCRAAGVAIVRNPYGARKYKVGETIAIVTIANLAKAHGDKAAADLLKVLVDAGVGPIGKDQIRAVEELLTNQDYAAEIEAADLAVAICKASEAGDKDARRFAADHNDPFWRGLVHVWFRAAKRRRRL